MLHIFLLGTGLESPSQTQYSEDQLCNIWVKAAATSMWRRSRARCQPHLQCGGCPVETPLFLGMEPSVQWLGSSDVMLPHLPPGGCVLDHAWTHPVILQVRPGEPLGSTRAQGSFSERKARARDHSHPLVVNRAAPPLPLRNQEAGSSAPQARGLESLGCQVGGSWWCPPRGPKPSFPASHQLSHSKSSSRHSIFHSEMGRMFWQWESPVRPEERRERLWSTRFSISLQLLRYWCRSREYTKGSEAALL